jgi:hypothetical protein
MAADWLGGEDPGDGAAAGGAAAPAAAVAAAAAAASNEVSHGGEALPGFREFVIQRFGGEVLVESLVAPGRRVDVRDAAAISWLTEVAAQLKGVHARCGAAFLAHLGGVALPRMGWPAAAREALLQHVAASDVKQLKAFLRSALAELQAQAPRLPA